MQEALIIGICWLQRVVFGPCTGCWHACSSQMVFLQELELLEAELQSALQQGRADPFVAYLYGVILSDR